MEGTITLQAVITAIDKGDVFDIEYCTADVARGTGGQLKAYKNVTKHRRQQLTATNQKKLDEASKSVAPNHYQNSTRNLYLLNTREIKKVHLRLITFFNGKRVI
jgi:hypothetical protein